MGIYHLSVKATQDSQYRKAIIDTCSYLIRDMQSPSGGFYSAEDAESYDSKESSQKREGAFYVWSIDQAAEALKATGLLDLAASYCGFRENGNAPQLELSSTELDGYNVIRIEKSIADLVRLGQFIDIETYGDMAKDTVVSSIPAMRKPPAAPC